jgi:hypothetical protein
MSTTIFGIDDEGQVLREHDIAALPQSQQDALALYVEDADGLQTLDETGDIVPADLDDLLAGLDASHRTIFKGFKAGNTFPDAAQATAAYVQQFAEHIGGEADEMAEDAAQIAAETTYNAWAMDRLEEAAVHENIDMPKSYDDALEQAFTAGEIGNRRKPYVRAAPALRTSMVDALDDFMSEVSDRNAVQNEARNALRAARRAQAEATD